jgi:membrane carboxypeptidase/penicillin-binding protein
VGYDEKRPLGPNETGAAAALPIWMDVMRTHIEAQRAAGRTLDFDAPGNIVFAAIQDGTTEAFISGTEPDGVTILPAVSGDDTEGGLPLPVAAPTDNR